MDGDKTQSRSTEVLVLYIKWDEATLVDHGRVIGELLVQVALHIQETLMDILFNRDRGTQIPGCWSATMHQKLSTIHP